MYDPFTYRLPTTATAPRYAALREAEGKASRTLHETVGPVVKPSALMVGAGRRATPNDFAAVNAATKAMYDCIRTVCPAGPDRERAEVAARHARMLANEALVVMRGPVDEFEPHRLLLSALDALRDARLWACASVALADDAELPVLPGGAE